MPLERSAGLQRKCKIKIIEIGYCSDTRYNEKLNEKKEQHARFCKILRKEGHDVEFLPVILGTYAPVSTCLPKALTAVGVSRQQQIKLEGKLVVHACNTHCNIL